MKRTYQQIAAFDRDARAYLARRDAQHKEQTGNGAAPPNKFTYAVNRVLKRARTALQDYQEQSEDINVKHCSEDKDGNIETDERGQYKFKRDGLMKRNEEQRKLFREHVEIEPYHATELPKDLTDEDRDIFLGFVIKETKP